MPVTPSPPYLKIAFLFSEGCIKKESTDQQKIHRQFIGSKKWKRIRKNLFKLRGKRCEKCGSKKTIQVHHLNYKRFGGDELPEDLQVLCCYHHMLVHGLIKKRRKRKKKKRRKKKKKVYFDENTPCWHFAD